MVRIFFITVESLKFSKKSLASSFNCKITLVPILSALSFSKLKPPFPSDPFPTHLFFPAFLDKTVISSDTINPE